MFWIIPFPVFRVMIGYALFVWLYEIILHHYLIKMFGVNRAWQYNDNDQEKKIRKIIPIQLPNCISLSCYPRWTVFGIINEILSILIIIKT